MTTAYSVLEQRLLSLLLGRREPIDTLDLIEEFYGKGSRMANPRQSVIALVNALQRKAKRNKEPFKVLKSKRDGPHPIEFWIAR